MKKLYLIGGGRWARIVLSEVLKLPDENLQVTVVSNKNYLFMKKWISKTFIDSKVFITKILPDVLEDNSFIYVLNETELRFDTLTKVLKYQMPILVEKPLGLNHYEAESVISLYERSSTPLLSAQVFKFLESVSAIKEILEPRTVHTILMSWLDSHSEVRFEEIKRYEDLVPPYLDILPHVFSLLEEIIGDFVVSYKSVTFNEVEKDFSLCLRINSSLDLKIKYSRKATKRARIFEFFTQSEKIAYDFSEIETIARFQEGQRVFYKEYVKSKSIQLMLTKFLSYSEGELMDGKFSHRANICALQISHEIQNALSLDSDC